MSSKKKYIEIDSTYRDRKQYPNPAFFLVNIGNPTTSNDSNTLINAVSQSYPIYNFQGPHPELVGIKKDFSGNDTQFLDGGTPQSLFGSTGQTQSFSVNHVSQYADVDGRNVIIDTTNPWNISVNVNNNNGSGNRFIPKLDGTSINTYGKGNSVHKNIQDSNILYPTIYQNNIDENRSYSGFPFSSSEDGYYNGLELSLYNTQDPSGSNPLETTTIKNYKGSDILYKNSIDSLSIGYNSTTTLTCSDIDSARVVYTAGDKSCELENPFSENWTSTKYWSINNTKLLNITTPQKIVIHGGSDIDDYYTGYYLEDCTLPLSSIQSSQTDNFNNLNSKNNRFKLIRKYDGKTKQATIINDDDFGFLCENKNTNRVIEDESYNLMNINSDRANRFVLPIGTNSSNTAIGAALSPPFNNTGTEYTWVGSDMSGANGWIPQDRYRIRKEIPLVMGWGFNEDRDGAHARTSLRSSNNDYSGTGPQNGMNGAVYDFIITDKGKNFTINSNEVYCVGTTYGNIVTNMFIQAINVGPNGELEEARIVWGGSNFQLNNEYTIFNGTGNNGKVKILSTGQSIDISNGFNGKTTGVLSTDYNKYKGELLYVPSRGPEKKSSQFLTKYNLTGYLQTNKPYNRGRDPPYIKQFPSKIERDVNNENQFIDYNVNDSGVVPINLYTYTNANLLRTNPTTTATWILKNTSETKYTSNAIATIISNNIFDTPVTGNMHNGTNSNNGKDSVYYFQTSTPVQDKIKGFNRVGLDNSHNWEILQCNGDGYKPLYYANSIEDTEYKMKLESLVVPNILLKNSNINKITSDSYIYIELSILTGNETNYSNVISSNNPNATQALFKVAITDIRDLDNSRFCKLYGDGQIQKIRFNSDQDITFKIYLSDGELFETSLTDNLLPSEVDPDLQISALFEII